MIFVGIPSIVEVIKNRGEPLPINLDEFSLDTVTEEEIINYKIHRAYRTKTKNYGDRTGADKYADKDYANNFISTHEITGIYVISTTKAVDCTLELNVSSELTGGRAKIVVIRDNEIVEYLDFGDGKQLVYDVKGEHLYVVKLVCEKAALEVTVNRNLR
jgi:hypothetical protein